MLYPRCERMLMLKDSQCKNAICPPDKARRRFTDAEGLYLEVRKEGGKLWRWKYRFDKAEKVMALGAYPAVSLAAARLSRDEAKLLKAKGIDPMAQRKQEKRKPVALVAATFKEVALEWFDTKRSAWCDGHASRTKRQLERDLFPYLGNRPLADIEPPELLAALKNVEKRGAVETASRGLLVATKVWRYAIPSGRASRDITIGLNESLKPHQTNKHFSAITEPNEFAELLKSIREYRGRGVAVHAALRLAPMLLLRPGELRSAEWCEVDLNAALWTVPAARMKRKKPGKLFGPPHFVPLATQAVAILRELQKHTGQGRFVFPGGRGDDRPISDNSVRTALIALGYTSDLHTWHGFRATARTILAERLEIDPLVIEAQLAHAVKDVNGRAYNRTTYLSQRKTMMQLWANYLDELGGNGSSDGVGVLALASEEEFA
jgi:integrase